VELTGYLAVARRWWWTLLVATWVAGIAGWIVASSIPPTYEARTQLLVGPYNTDRETLAASADLVQTYSELITTDPILESAILESGATLTAADLEAATRVTADNTTRILSIRVQDTDPQMAATLANRLADEISLLASKGTARPEGQIQQVDFAKPPIDPVAPQRSLIVALAAIAALIGAMVLVLLVEYLSAAVRSEDELTRVTDLPFLGKVDTARSLPSNSRALVDNDPESAAAAAYRLVLAKLAFRQGQGEPVRSIVVVGTGALSAAGQVAANLGAITARGGRQVVIVDADTAEGPITRIFGLNDRAGLTDELATGGQDLTDALEPVTNTLSVVPRGAAPGEDQLDISRAKGMLASLARRADIVIVSTGPLHLSAGALAWAQAGDAVAIVATLDQSRRDDLAYAVESLRLVGANVTGTVLAERRRSIGRARRAPAPATRGEAPPPARRPAAPLYDRPSTIGQDRVAQDRISPVPAAPAYVPPTPPPGPTVVSYSSAPRFPTVVRPVEDVDDEPPPEPPTKPRRTTRRRRQAGESST
jgi:succinoglycan biosynthesis transport protein ExoP